MESEYRKYHARDVDQKKCGLTINPPEWKTSQHESCVCILRHPSADSFQSDNIAWENRDQSMERIKKKKPEMLLLHMH